MALYKTPLKWAVDQTNSTKKRYRPWVRGCPDLLSRSSSSKLLRMKLPVNVEEFHNGTLLRRKPVNANEIPYRKKRCGNHEDTRTENSRSLAVWWRYARLSQHIWKKLPARFGIVFRAQCIYCGILNYSIQLIFKAMNRKHINSIYMIWYLIFISWVI